MIQPLVAEHLVERIDGAGFGIGGAVDDGGEAGLNDGAGTHRAGL